MSFGGITVGYSHFPSSGPQHFPSSPRNSTTHKVSTALPKPAPASTFHPPGPKQRSVSLDPKVYIPPTSHQSTANASSSSSYPLTTTRSRRKSCTAASVLERFADGGMNSLGPRRRDGVGGSVDSLGISLGSDRNESSALSMDSRELGVKKVDVFDEIKADRANAKGVDSSSLPQIHSLLHTSLSTHRIRIQTLQSTIQHRLEEFDTMKYRMKTFDREARVLFEGMMGGEEVEGNGSGEEGREGEEDRENERELNANGDAANLAEGSSQPGKDSSSTAVPDPPLSDIILLNPSTSAPLPVSDTTLPQPLLDIFSTLQTTTTSLSSISDGLSERVRALASVREMIGRLPQVEEELERRIREKREEIRQAKIQNKRRERRITIAWLTGITSTLILLFAWLLSYTYQ